MSLHLTNSIRVSSHTPLSILKLYILFLFRRRGLSRTTTSRWPVSFSAEPDTALDPLDLDPGEVMGSLIGMGHKRHSENFALSVGTPLSW